MKHKRHEWLSALASGFLTGIIFTAILCLAVKWFREGIFDWLLFQTASECMSSLFGAAVTV